MTALLTKLVSFANQWDERSYKQVCSTLGLIKFARLAPTSSSNLEIQVLMSSLEDQWRWRWQQQQAELSQLPKEGADERGVSNTSQFDVLTAVAVARINSSSSGSSEVVPVETTAAASLSNQLHGSTANQGGVRSPTVFDGDSTAEVTDGEQLTRKDLLLQGWFMCHLSKHQLTGGHSIASDHIQRRRDLGYSGMVRLGIASIIQC